MSGVFVTGIGTEVGKTLAACALIKAARARGMAVDAFKPVLSGFDAADAQASDAGRLLAALGRPLTPQRLDDIAPLRFAAPLSPPDAARREGRAISLADLKTRCIERMASDRLLLIEGAGGVMSPIADDGLNLDLIAALDLPVLLCASNYLGAISHGLTALSALQAQKIKVTAVLVQTLEPVAPDLADTLAALRQYAQGVRILAGDGWEDAVLSAATGTRPGLG